jgi:prophage regulatory protein
MIENNKLLRPAQLAAKLGINTTTLWRWRKNDQIPAPIKLSNRLIGWRESTIEEWLSDKENS